MGDRITVIGLLIVCQDQSPITTMWIINIQPCLQGDFKGRKGDIIYMKTHLVTDDIQ